jgi:pimeloyl-ACP methyl ester carboxylesterase
VNCNGGVRYAAIRKRAMSQRQGSVVTDDGVRLAYKVAGEGSRNLLLMHGWAGSANSWNGFNKSVDSQRFRAVAFDIRGHGDSDKVTTGFTDERFAKDALAVADAAGAPKFTPVGFSMSGRFVQYLPLIAAERVEGMVIVAGCPVSAMALPEEVITDWVGRAGDREKLREVPLMFAVKPDMALIDEFADDAAKASRHALEATLRMLLTSFEEQFKSRPAMTPLLVLAGKSDQLLGPDVQRAIAAKYSKSKVIEFDCGHELLVEVPNEAAERVSEFVAKLPN